MPFHDAYLRRTPWESAFAAAEGAAELPGAVREEAGAHGVDPCDPHAFLSLECVSGFVRSVRGPEAGGTALVEHAALAYHGVRFSEPDRRALLVTTDAARALVAAGPEGASARPPSPSGYVQLPRHLFWVATGTAGTAEAVDGWFWSVTPADELLTLLVAGVRDDRAGFAAVPLPEAPLADAASWTSAVVRAEGEDFAPTLPGGELGGLYSIEAAGEVLKLTARIFARLAGGAGRPGPEAPEDRGDAPAPSGLTYTILET